MSDQGFGWPFGFDVSFDRRVDHEFVDLFEKGVGLLRTLPEYARRARYPVDLQFRREVRSGAQRATLYVGLQVALQVHWRQGELRFSGHSRLGRRAGFDDHWTEWMSVKAADEHIRAVETYLDRVIPRIAASGAEGAVQAAATSFDSDDAVVLDREFALQFRDRTVRDRVMREVTRDIVAAVASAPVEYDPPERFGWRCDLIAARRNGELLAIEVKPRNMASIVWSPAQAIVYARLLELWMRNDVDAVAVIEWMERTRRALRLIRDEALSFDSRAEVRPVVAIQRGSDDAVIDAMAAVRNHLANHGIAEAERLEISEVSLSGRIIPLH